MPLVSGNTMNSKEAEDLLTCLDGSGSDKEYEAIKKLKLLGDELPRLLLEKYQSSRKWQVRSSCVYHSIRLARGNENAFSIGIEALRDKSKVVRYRACMLLAYSLNISALPMLEDLKLNTADRETKADAIAAIDAITNKNSNFFVDREHSGNISLNVN
jgi:hypothetical protein